MTVKLSICIATYNRGDFISDTLDSILKQIEPNVEVVVVDGASPDNTSDVMKGYLSKWSQIRYFRELVNSGVDADFDKAVGYANGEFCWLMADDDLLLPDAITTVLASINDKNDLIVVNSELRNLDFSSIYEKQRLILYADKEYSGKDRESFFEDTASYLSFIGCVVVRKAFWLSRDRVSYYGTLFIHVGVLFQSPAIQNVKVLAKPLISIRYGNAMWTSRGFEIWAFKWPKLIWSFPDFSDACKKSVNYREPWRNNRILFYYRGLGAYNYSEFSKLLSKNVSGFQRAKATLISIFPASLANFILVIYFLIKAKQSKMIMHDFLYAPTAGFLTQFLAKTLRLKNLLK
jgi:abequosyltransferase